LSFKRKSHGRESSIVDHQVDCASLGTNPLMGETSMVDLLG